MHRSHNFLFSYIMLIYIKIIIYFVILRDMIIWNVFIPNLRIIFHPKHFNKLEIKKLKIILLNTAICMVLKQLTN